MIKEKIKELIKEALEKAGISYDGEISLEHPGEEIHGDYSSNIAMRLAKSLKRNPYEISLEIVNNIPKNNFTSEIRAIKPGFINIFLKNDQLIEYMQEALKAGSEYGKLSAKRGQKIMVEFAHPNTHKMFHIGHLRNATTGECLVRILEANGAKVIRANYEGDVGLHIAKCLYSILNNLNPKSEIRNPHFALRASRGKPKQIQNPNVQNSKLIANLESEYKTIKERVEFLGKMYAEGNKAYETDNEAKAEILRINKLIYLVTEKKFDDSNHRTLMDEEGLIYRLWKETRQWSLDYFETIYKRLETRFDRYYFESEVWERGKELVLKGLDKGIFKASEGAVVFPGEKFGTHTRVFITQEGNVTYEGKDMGLGELQFKEYEPDLIVHCVGPEQIEYFKVMFQALEQLFPEKKEKEKHVPYGWVKLKHGKMSSREGNVVLGEWLLDEAKERVERIISESTTPLRPDQIGTSEGQAGIKSTTGEIEQIAEKVAVAAVKYSFLKVSLPSEIAFDFEESINFQGDSGPYLMYTYARTRSVMEKIRNPKSEIRNNFQNSIFQNLKPEEVSLLRWIYRFLEVVREAGEKYAPNLICAYLFELAQRYNLFYNKLPILKAETEEIRNFRLVLNEAVGIIIKNGLHLLGIEAVEKM